MDKNNIVLIGFMGVGKTSIGKKLASFYGMDFIDTDMEIEKLTGMTVSQIFARHGEIRFRSEENLVIAKVADCSGCVISTGGGAVINVDNVNALRKNGVLVCLRAAPEVIQERVSKRGGRPLLHKDRSLERIIQLLEEREPFYAMADFSVDTSELTQDETLTRIVDYLKERGFPGGNPYC